MSEKKIADIGWHELLIEKLEGALKLSREIASDIGDMEMCDGSGCGRMFDGRDPRAAVTQEKGATYHFCPGCNLEAQIAADQRGKDA